MPSPPISSPPPPKYTYSVLNLFQQSLSETDPKTFDSVSTNFGLLPFSPSSDLTNPTQEWHTLHAHLTNLNLNSCTTTTTSSSSFPPKTTYKLLYLSRHGQGLHNLAEATYGRLAWNETYAAHTGNPILGSWVDAPLTPLGITQATQSQQFWQKMIEMGALVPQKFYVSPLDRCLATAKHTWADIVLPDGARWKPIVKEGLRETLGLHTCDKRSPVSVLRGRYPEVEFPGELAEGDELWDAGRRETDEETAERAKAFLDSVWDDGAMVVSLTSHSGWIRAALGVVGHREFRLKTGRVVPVVVKGERVDGDGVRCGDGERME